MEFNEFYSKYTEDIAVIKSNQSMHDRHIADMEKDIQDLKNENKAIYEINTNVRLLAEGMNTVKNDINEFKDDIKNVRAEYTKLDEKVGKEVKDIKKDINDVQHQPEKSKAAWWDKVVWLVVGGTLSAIVALLLNRL